MENQKEPTLEEYGLTASSYEEYRNQKKELEDSFDKFKNEVENKYPEHFQPIGIIFIVIGTVGSLFSLIISTFGVVFFIFLGLFFLGLFFEKIDSNTIKKRNSIIDPKEKDKNYKIEQIKEKVYLFEEDCANYYLKFKEEFYNNNLYRKHKNTEKYKRFSEIYSSINNEIVSISQKFIFEHDILSSNLEFFKRHKNWLFSYIINYKNKVDYHFNSFSNIKFTDKTEDELQNYLEEESKKEKTKEITQIIQNTTQTKPVVEKPKEIYEHDYLNKYIKDTENLDNDKNQEFEITNHSEEEIKQITHTEENNKKKGFWAEIMDEVKGEIENGNNKNSVHNDIETIKPIENISPDKKYYAPRKIDWDNINKDKKITGLKGEEIVMEIEKNYLNSINMGDLADKVRHISKEDGDGAGYDILSFYPDGQDKYIEVKSTMKSSGKSFYLSQNELDFLKKNKDNACVYRIFNVNENEDAPYLKVYRADDILIRAIIPVQYIVKMD